MADGAFDVSGRCLCGAVTYKAKATSHDVNACHCGMCRRWTGGPLIYIHAEGKPEFTGGEALGVFRSSEWGERGFCKKCGSDPVLEDRWQGSLHLHGGLARR